MPPPEKPQAQRLGQATSLPESFLPPALAHLLEASADAIFTLDREGHITYVNRRAAAIAGLTPPEVIGRHLERDLPHTFSSRWLSESRRAREENRPVEYDTFNPAVGGWLRVQVVPTPSGLAVQIRDVTFARRTEALQRVTAALAGTRTPEQVVRVLLKQTVDAAGAQRGGLFLPDRDGTHLELRGEVGYTPELLERFARLPLALEVPLCKAAREQQPVFVGGTVDAQYPEAARLRAQDTRSLAALPLLVEGNLWGVLVLSFGEARHFRSQEQAFLLSLVEQCVQALSRIQAEQELRTQADTLKTLNRIGRTLSAELDLDRLVQAVTDAGVELTGAQFGAFFYNLTDRHQQTHTLYALAGAAREAFASFPLPRTTPVFGPTFRGEGAVRVADITRDERYGQNPPYHGMPPGHLPVRSYLAVPVVTRSGEVLGGLFFGHGEPGIFSEQAEQFALGLASQTAVALDNARLYGQLQQSHAELERRVEERTAQLAAQAAELQRSNAELEQFAYVASHDLQAPIRAVTSFAGLIARRYEAQLDARGQTYLRQIVESGEHMKRLVDDLLAFSRVHTEQRERQPVDSGAVLRAVLARLRPDLDLLEAQLQIGALPTVLADASQLDQLFQNLLSNALKYRRPQVRPEVRVSAEREGEVWRFAVMDNGIGIEAQYFERIFVIFQRLHGQGEYEGTGIGLAVCQKIVERHGGRLWVESTPGAGSTFFFTLPAAENNLPS
ncbi:GAF domain-containing protein [Deinococcus sp. YIM 77859]|uniref:GAF domain-containing protein n=1 Tax=Deinococcus sp. YIM 77859 TaxID=1540221 RepID=UPI00068E19FF|nr:GAF domain-containing protein [Deinococcus sp. YIM 77859]